MNQVIQHPATVDERLAELERQFAELRDRVLRLTPVKKDWQSTFGMMPDDELSREAERLGREWRESCREP
ncbi:hypothetical protein LBMAG56_25020 [Verrucomicrobiota bacterium]|nr:hypothetical protein LBMAG56_25020 [Verrucomicrobiota bacterium]